MAKAKKYKKPNAIIYGVFYIISKIVCFFKLGLKIKRNEVKGKKGGFVIIANHGSSIDFMPLCVALKRRAHFVISNAFYSSLPIQPLLNSAGVIPKNQFQTSVSEMRAMKNVLENEMPLVLYPAGLMTENGIGTPIPLATGKTLKWFGKDVYVAKSFGVYFSHPKWAKKWRKGKVSLDVYKLFDKDELVNLSEEELQKTIEEHLSFDEYAIQKEKKIAFHGGDSVKGLENVLYKCPNCKEEFTFSVKDKNKLTCEKCGYTVKSDKYGLFNSNNEKEIIFDTVSDWFRWIEKEAKEEISKENFLLSSKAEVYMINYKKHRFEKRGECDITLDNKEFVIDGSKYNLDIKKSFATKIFPILPFKPGRSFDLQDGREIYRIELENGKETIKWITCLREIYKTQK